MKKILVAALACATLTGGFLMSNEVNAAAFTLSEDVKTATPALLSTAANIGVRHNANTKLAKLPSKKALVIASFGTTIKETREKTIDATIRDIKNANPGLKVVTAFTSHIIIDRIKANEGISYPTPEEAMEQLKAEGYTEVAMTSLDIIPGLEYDYKTAVYEQYKNNFKKASIGTPLLYWQGQEGRADEVKSVMADFAKHFPKMGKKDAVLIMAHGTPHIANAYYSVMQDRLEQLGYDNAYIYSVEGYPHLDTIIPQLKDKKIKNVTLMPFMMVAGDHAMNDMAGNEDDSHKIILQKEGFKVKTILKGLGEYKEIRNVFTAKAQAALDALK